MKIGDLLEAANASINAVAEAFMTLNSLGAADLIEGRIALNKRGRRLVLKERRSFFFPRVSVHYRSGATTSRHRLPKDESLLEDRLPDSYRLGAIDAERTDA